MSQMIESGRHWLASPDIYTDCIVFKFSCQYKHYEYTRTTRKNERGAGTPKNPNDILSRCP